MDGYDENCDKVFGKHTWNILFLLHLRSFISIRYFISPLIISFNLLFHFLSSFFSFGLSFSFLFSFHFFFHFLCFFLSSLFVHSNVSCFTYFKHSFFFHSKMTIFINRFLHFRFKILDIFFILSSSQKLYRQNASFVMKTKMPFFPLFFLTFLFYWQLKNRTKFPLNF